MPLKGNILPDAPRPPSMETIVKARDMYAQGFSVSRVLAICNMSHGTLYHWLDGGPPGEGGAPMLEPVPRRRPLVVKQRRPLAADRASLAARLLRTAERQARDIEVRLARPSAATPERERDVRMLMMLVRALRDLCGFADPAEAAKAAAEVEEARSIDEFREALAKRIEEFAAVHGVPSQQDAEGEQAEGEGMTEAPLPPAAPAPRA
ncbi:MAG: hypothetical protein ACK4UO_19320 [Pseudolabrys sp.]